MLSTLLQLRITKRMSLAFKSTSKKLNH